MNALRSVGRALGRLVPRTRRARIAAGAGGVVAVLVAVVLGVCWYASGVIGCRLILPQRAPPDFQVQITAVDATSVTLHVSSEHGYCGTANTNWRKAGTWGLDWLGGYAEVGAILHLDEQAREVTRTLTRVRGEPVAGQYARFDSLLYPENPLTALGIPFHEVTYHGDLGDYPAWQTDGTRDTWVIFVHGRGAGRRDALRVLPTLVSMGFPTLTITYRDDVDAPGGESGAYGFGATEWRDLEAATRYALDHGAQAVVPYGYSMGGAIVVSFLLHSSLAARVPAAVLDAPTLDYGAIARSGLRDAGIPGPLASLTLWIAERRYGVDFGAVNYLRRADELHTPILLFHGVLDDLVPVATSDAFAAERPDIVTYERFPDAQHTRSWNLDPGRYEQALRDYLSGIGAPPRAGQTSD